METKITTKQEQTCWICLGESISLNITGGGGGGWSLRGETLVCASSDGRSEVDSERSGARLARRCGGKYSSCCSRCNCSDLDNACAIATDTRQRRDVINTQPPPDQTRYIHGRWDPIQVDPRPRTPNQCSLAHTLITVETSRHWHQSTITLNQRFKKIQIQIEIVRRE